VGKGGVLGSKKERRIPYEQTRGYGFFDVVTREEGKKELDGTGLGRYPRKKDQRRFQFEEIAPLKALRSSVIVILVVRSFFWGRGKERAGTLARSACSSTEGGGGGGRT